MPACEICGCKTKNRCGRCQSTFYCTRAHQAEAWKQHKSSCNPPAPETNVHSSSQAQPPSSVTIKGVKLDGPWTEVDIDENDPIWTQGTLCPVPHIFGVPLIIWRHIRRDPLSFPRDKKLDNQPATWLMIDPHTGFAPLAWQGNVGPVTIARSDKQPLLSAQLDIIHEFVSHLLDLFGVTGMPGSVPRDRMGRDAFRRFWRMTVPGKKADQLVYGRGWANLVDWDAVPCPC